MTRPGDFGSGAGPVSPVVHTSHSAISSFPMDCRQGPATFQVCCRWWLGWMVDTTVSCLGSPFSPVHSPVA